MGGIAAVLNDSSGTGECATKARQLEEIFAAAGRAARVTVVRGGDDLRKSMEDAVGSGCELLVAGGGDGTINTAASVLAGRDIPLGVLPLGTLNHFAKDLEIPLELEEAAGVALNGTVCRVDVGEVNGRIFVNNSSLGVYPAIVRLRERYREGGRSKWVAALWASLVVLRRNPFMAVRITADQQATVRRTPFVFVGNNEYKMAGLEAGKRESLVQRRLAVYVMNAEQRNVSHRASPSRRQVAKAAVVALAAIGLGAAGLSGALAKHSDGWDDDVISAPSGGSGGDDDWVFGSGGSGGDDDWVFGGSGSGGSGWDD